MDSQESYFLAQLRSLVAPTPSSAAFPSSTRPVATRIGYVHLQFFPTPLKRRRPYTGATQKEIKERTARF
jgi:hypothetical protein